MANLVYLRASTKEQDASRAIETILTFLGENNQQADAVYMENESGSKLDRPELMRLIDEAQKDDCIVVEQIDRLTRLTAEDWKELKAQIDSKGLLVVSLDLPTSHTVYTATKMDSFTKGVLDGVNRLIMDILAATARKDYEDRRRRQAEGIKAAKAEGKYKGKQQHPDTVAKCKEALEMIADLGYSKEKAAKRAGVGIATLYRFIKEKRELLGN
ncbi:recombinase family protein [Vibrio parahaemolyticus]|uniref:recombinase family protein n=1 Tax=Vibrio parahaemolyticus TaxID=670 RepID=UPI00084B4103|nr:recombinase family protein [Vibrio parahaemolyticus]OEA68643.1 hypothetical protein BBM67_19465 [Vibrio parahaemolyticus]OEA76262.1 hypothetical protein BBM68_08700 [Vibrio parahaemolyticus]